MQGIRTRADDYLYNQGTAPQNAGEIAITPLIAEKLNAGIGDTITISHSFGKRDYIVTALYQSMNNMGEGVRLHETAETDFAQTSGFLSFQVDFTDNPDQELIADRIEHMRQLFDPNEVRTAGEYIDAMVGVSSVLQGIRSLTLGVVLIAIALVTVLMECSFITKERSEIAILKATGFETASIITWHTIRFGFIGIVSTIIALLLTVPLTHFSITPIFRMMGAAYGVTYRIVPLEVFGLYPLLVLAITIISSFFISLYTKSITASEASFIV